MIGNEWQRVAANGKRGVTSSSSQLASPRRARGCGTHIADVGQPVREAHALEGGASLEGSLGKGKGGGRSYWLRRRDGLAASRGVGEGSGGKMPPNRIGVVSRMDVAKLMGADYHSSPVSVFSARQISASPPAAMHRQHPPFIVTRSRSLPLVIRRRKLVSPHCHASCPRCHLNATR